MLSFLIFVWVRVQWLLSDKEVSGVF
jgi:hypothetical protein